MSRRWWVLCLAVLLAGVAVLWSLYVVADRPRRSINRARFELIEDGMSREEAIAAIGLPPGDYTVFKRPLLDWTPPLMLGTSVQEGWSSDEGLILVVFQDDKVAERRYY